MNIIFNIFKGRVEEKNCEAEDAEVNLIVVLHTSHRTRKV